MSCNNYVGTAAWSVMGEAGPPDDDVIGAGDSSFEDFVAGSSVRLFTMAGSGIPETYAPGLTMFWEGYVTDLRGCIPLEVRSRSASTPIRVTVAAPAAAAAHSC
jgi:hypothetical protein